MFFLAQSNVVAIDRAMKCAYVCAYVKEHANSILVCFAGLLGSLGEANYREEMVGVMLLECVRVCRKAVERVVPQSHHSEYIYSFYKI